ncbi:MAG: gliding motility-associated C-terminal domain-containing protein [Bacteroidetes bacterium]|nr:gliding motility-associated C-terminal domain-containing protein [Bacteroidota bacterium]
MKKYFLLTSACLLVSYFISAQVWNDEIIFRMEMKNQGMTEEMINQAVNEHTQFLKEGKTISTPAQFKNNFIPVPNAVCSDLGVENGWGAWQAFQGKNIQGGGLSLAPTSPVSPRFTLMSGNGIDACTPGPLAGSPVITEVAPGFGNYTIRLGEPNTNGVQGGCCNTVTAGCAEQLIYPLSVTAQDTNFVYSYAIVIENPQNGHLVSEAPYAEIYILDSKGDTVPCSHHKYMGNVLDSSVAPGMYRGGCASTYIPAWKDITYKPWTIEGINLSAYVGQALTVVLTNADCQQGGHFCHSYWDFSCGIINGTKTLNCNAAVQDTFCAPGSDPSNPYTYAWTQNGNAAVIGTSQCLIATVNPNDTFYVEVQQQSGCPFHLIYVPNTQQVSPAFSTSGNCSSLSFTDNTASNPAWTIASWNWSFPGGNPSSSTLQNPGPIIFPAGTYTITLTVTTNTGCTGTVQQVITFGTPPTISVTSFSSCSSANNGSASAIVSGGSSPYTYNWSPAAGSNSSVSGLAGGTYTVLVTDANGCATSATTTVSVSPPPVASATSATVCAGQNAILTASGGGNYLWSNGATASSITISSAGNYSVIVSVGSCADTAYSSVMVTPSPSVNLGNNQTLCDGQNFMLNAGNAGAGYLWSTGETSQTISVSGAGTYWVIVALNNCLAKDTVQTFIAPKVHLFDSSLCTASPIVLDAGSNASSYSWSNGAATQTISVSEAGNYWVQASFGNCVSSDTAKITGMEGGAGALYVPNAFTPNGDRLNEIFLAKGEGITSFDMKIFDRWGNLIFASANMKEGWDGKIQGGHYLLKEDGSEPAQEDVYIWKINYTTQCFPAKEMRETGQVSIVK